MPKVHADLRFQMKQPKINKCKNGLEKKGNVVGSSNFKY